MPTHLFLSPETQRGLAFDTLFCFISYFRGDSAGGWLSYLYLLFLILLWFFSCSLVGFRFSSFEDDGSV